MAKESLMKPTQITSAPTIPTPVANAIVSLTTRQTTATPSSTTCALSVGRRANPHGKTSSRANRPNSATTFKSVREVVKTLVDVHRTAAHKAWVPAAQCSFPFPVLRLVLAPVQRRLQVLPPRRVPMLAQQEIYPYPSQDTPLPSHRAMIPQAPPMLHPMKVWIPLEYSKKIKM